MATTGKSMADGEITAAANPAIELHITPRTAERLEKVVRDGAVSAFFNALAFVSGGTLMAKLGWEGGLLPWFTLAAEGTAVMGAGIVAGRYLGGGLGRALDAVTGNHEGKYRDKGKAAGSVIGGASSFFFFQTGRFDFYARVIL